MRWGVVQLLEHLNFVTYDTVRESSSMTNFESFPELRPPELQCIQTIHLVVFFSVFHFPVVMFFQRVVLHGWSQHGLSQRFVLSDLNWAFLTTTISLQVQTSYSPKVNNPGYPPEVSFLASTSRFVGRGSNIFLSWCLEVLFAGLKCQHTASEQVFRCYGFLRFS